MSDDELVELPGGIDQLEAIVENMNQPEDNSKLVFTNHSKAGEVLYFNSSNIFNIEN